MHMGKAILFSYFVKEKYKLILSESQTKYLRQAFSYLNKS